MQWLCTKCGYKFTAKKEKTKFKRQCRKCFSRKLSAVPTDTMTMRDVASTSVQKKEDKFDIAITGEQSKQLYIISMREDKEIPEIVDELIKIYKCILKEDLSLEHIKALVSLIKEMKDRNWEINQLCEFITSGYNELNRLERDVATKKNELTNIETRIKDWHQYMTEKCAWGLTELLHVTYGIKKKPTFRDEVDKIFYDTVYNLYTEVMKKHQSALDNSLIPKPVDGCSHCAT